jgi:hypothetical protein
VPACERGELAGCGRGGLRALGRGRRHDAQLSS